MKNANIEIQIEKLEKRMGILFCKEPYNAQLRHINKISSQLRYLEKQIHPSIKEGNE